MDVIANMLITVKNGGAVGKDTVTVPFSKFKMAIAQKLFDQGYVASYKKTGEDKKPTLEIGVAYTDKGTPRINALKRISKLSRRVYYRTKDIRPVRNGHGIIVLSTPKGIMTGDEARKELVGGEALFEIW